MDAQNKTLSVLIVDDDKKGAKLLGRSLSLSASIHTQCVFSGEEAVLKCRESEFDAFLVDLNLPKMDGIQTLKMIKKMRPFCPVIIITGHNEIQTAVRAIKEGAFDYIVKPLEIDHVADVILRSCAQVRLMPKNGTGKTTKDLSKLDEIIYAGSSPLAHVMEMAEKIAGSDASILITGNSGTGKELFAQRIHSKSCRSHNPFIVVNCGAIPAELFESELFGHVKGAFTGAVDKRDGLFTLADKGTLFLDEIAELPLAMQVKLLRALQSGEVRRIGSNDISYVNVRVIGATAKKLDEEISSGHFREDLYYRLNVINLTIPPLNDRQEDIPVLTEYFIRNIRIEGKIIKGIEPSAMEILKRHTWPGNVRELKNTIERLMLLCGGEWITLNEVEKDLGSKIQHMETAVSSGHVTLEDMEMEQIKRTLELTGGNKMQAAKRLGITVQTLYNKLSKLAEKGKIRPSDENKP
ncbi:MAG: sigma-54-dependent Fis family transcriptional regulator [Candidatus Aureabacteria bacterium]|nr:sigma-54-dependent Fis family transcriptional regulator [Candidatus Auribacterota bacterium]